MRMPAINILCRETIDHIERDDLSAAFYSTLAAHELIKNELVKKRLATIEPQFTELAAECGRSSKEVNHNQDTEVNHAGAVSEARRGDRVNFAER